MNYNINIKKIIYTHKILEREKPGYLKPTISSINKRSRYYKKNNDLLYFLRYFKFKI